MANMELFAVVHGVSPASRRMFSVMAPVGVSVGELRELVYAELKSDLGGISAHNIRLWKVPLICSFHLLVY